MKVKLFQLPVSNQHKKAEKHIPKPLSANMRMNLIGESGSGKTQFMFNVLFNWMITYLKKSNAIIHFVAGTHDTAVEVAIFANKLKYKPANFKIHTKFDLDKLKEIYDEHDGITPLLFVLDDCAYLKNFSNPQKKNFLTELYAGGRHKNCGIIVSLQKYLFLEEACRSINCTHLVLYNMNKKEVEKFYNENLSLMMGREEFDDILRKHLNKPYRFILLDKKNKKIHDYEGKVIYEANKEGVELK